MSGNRNLSYTEISTSAGMTKIMCLKKLLFSLPYTAARKRIEYSCLDERNASSAHRRKHGMMNIEVIPMKNSAHTVPSSPKEF